MADVGIEGLSYTYSDYSSGSVFLTAGKVSSWSEP